MVLSANPSQNIAFVPAAHCFYISGEKLEADRVIVGLGKLFSSLNQREDAAIISYVSTYNLYS